MDAIHSPIWAEDDPEMKPDESTCGPRSLAAIAVGVKHGKDAFLSVICMMIRARAAAPPAGSWTPRLYNFVHCDLSYTNRFKCTMSLVLHICTCTGSGVMFRPASPRSVPSHRCR
eukprot:COSAG03_NODE_3558_length_1949_cov_2.637838_4_plen_115_part_00